MTGFPNFAISQGIAPTTPLSPQGAFLRSPIYQYSSPASTPYVVPPDRDLSEY